MSLTAVACEIRVRWVPAGWRCHSWLVPPEVIHPPTTRTGPGRQQATGECTCLQCPPTTLTARVSLLGWWGGPGLSLNHVYSLVAPSSDSPLHLDRGNQPKVTASFFAAVQPYSQTFLPFTRIFKLFTINALSASPGGCG